AGARLQRRGTDGAGAPLLRNPAVRGPDMISRRTLLKSLGATAFAGSALSMPAIARANGAAAGRVVIVGGGFGGATAAKYIKRSAPDIEVTLVEAQARHYTCPFSNLY